MIQNSAHDVRKAQLQMKPILGRAQLQLGQNSLLRFWGFSPWGMRLLLLVCALVPIPSIQAQSSDPVPISTPDKPNPKPFNVTVRVSIIVDEAGLPTDIKIVHSDDHSFDKQARFIAATRRFTPATQHGKPVKVLVNVDINFQSKPAPDKSLGPEPPPEVSHQ